MARSNHSALATEAWRLVFELFMRTRPHRDAVLERLKLTPNDSKALATLDRAEGKPMSALADLWGTDPSNATWVVDRLERLKLAERRARPDDRRVKLVVLTARGDATKHAILDAFHEPPSELSELAADDLQSLCEILRKVPRARKG